MNSAGLHSPFDFIGGEQLLIDKPAGWTSFDAVNKVRSILGRYLHLKKLKVGHAGTLDPFATGLLIICTGGMTKAITGMAEFDKEYNGTFTLGVTTPSFDPETEPDQRFDISHIHPEDLHLAAQSFQGRQEQVPPAFSAKKIAGKRAYLYARKNQEVELTPASIQISKFELTLVMLPEVSFILECSKGTYVRALARDFGQKLGTGAYLSSLRRTRIGPYHIDNAMSISQFEMNIRNSLML